MAEIEIWTEVGTADDDLMGKNKEQKTKNLWVGIQKTRGLRL